MKLIDNVFYINDGTPEHTLTLYLPEASSYPVLVYFHGGGLERGNSRKADVLA